MSATLKQIAKLAGVSIGTVDRALHDRGRVNKEVAERIKLLAAELNYKPNAAAQGLKSRDKRIKIAVVLHLQTMNAFTFQVLDGVRRCARELESFGATVEIIHSRDFDVDSQLKNIDRIVSEQYNGLILVPIHDPRITKKINDLHQANFPVILLTNILEDCNYYSYIGCNYQIAGAIAAGLAARFCQGNGHVLLFSPSFQMYGHVLRHKGMMSVFEKNYPNIHVQAVKELSSKEIEDYKCVLETLRQFPNPDIIICPGAFGNGIFTAIQEETCPEKTRIICFDTTDRMLPLLNNNTICAAITQDPMRQGYTAVHHMFSLLSGEPETKRGTNYYISSRIFMQENLGELNYI